MNAATPVTMPLTMPLTTPVTMPLTMPLTTPVTMPVRVPRPLARPGQGYTLLELLVVILVLGILLAVMAPTFSEYLRQQRLQDDAFAAVSTFKYAVSEVRRQNTPVTLTIAGDTMKVVRGTTTLRQIKLRTAPTLRCHTLSAACPAGGAFPLSAPFGRNDLDFSLTFSSGSQKRALLVRGPLGLVSVQ